MATIRISDTTRAALQRTALFLTAQAMWLQATGSERTLPQVRRYIDTLERLARSPEAATISPEDCEALQQAAFLLEGGRNSYRNTDFRDRAEKVDSDLTQVYNLLKECNSQAADE
jgi:hypothetical protein